MNKTITLPQSKVFLLQRWISTVAVGLTGIILAAWFLGAIPFYHRSTGIITTWEFLLEVLNIGRKSFVEVICRVGFGVLYYVWAVKMVCDWFRTLKNAKKWFSPQPDSTETRGEVNKCVRLFNSTLWKVLLLLVLSFFAENFRLTGAALAMVILSLACALVLNFALFFYVLRNPFESIVVSASRVLLLVGILLFCFRVATVEMEDVFKSFVSFFALFGVENAPSLLYWEALLQTVVTPIVYIGIAISLLRLGRDTFVYNSGVASEAKKLMIKSIVITVAIVVASGLTSRYRSGGDYAGLIVKNILLVGLPAFAYLAGMNTKICVEEAPVLESPAFEEQDTVASEGESTENEAVAEQAADEPEVDANEE